MYQFGEKIKHLRELNGFLQRDVAKQLAIDAPMLSKIESGERKAKREQIATLGKLFNVSENDLLSLWLADKVYDMIKDENLALIAISKAKKQIRIKNRKK